MADIGERILNRRKELGMTQEELAQKIGYSDKSMIAKIEKGLVDIPQSKILALADALEIPAGELMGDDGVVDSHRRTTTIPVLGRVAAGIPIEAVQDILDTEEIDEATARSGEFFALKLKGDSMEPRMCDGDVVIVRQQETADDGDIVIASVNGNDATCKRLKKYRDGIALVSINPSYEPMYFSNEEIENTPIKIWGKVVELRGKL